MANSTRSATRRKSANRKPEKPYRDFPLFAHATGRWAKKIRGRLHYFGRWAHKQNGTLERVAGDGWREALEEYQRTIDDLMAGRTPRPKDEADGATMRDLCNAFLSAKQDKLESGELSAGMMMNYRMATDRLIAHFGRFRRLDDLRPEDFAAFRKKLAKGRSLVTLKNNVNLCRIVIKFAYDHALVDRPIRYGQAFDKPSRKNLQQERNEAGPKLFARDELLRILGECDPILKAMVLLAVNGGLGNTDIANLQMSAIDWQGGWLDYPRPKTAIERRIPLWPETLEALRVAIERRPKPKDSADDKLCFVTREGHRCVRMTPHKTREGIYSKRDSVGDRFGKLLKRLDINGRKGLGFYTLRHVFETQAGGCKDQVAIDAIMGHADQSMAAHYREGLEDNRLVAVTQHVHAWLWPKAAAGKDVKHKRKLKANNRRGG